MLARKFHKVSKKVGRAVEIPTPVPLKQIAMHLKPSPPLFSNEAFRSTPFAELVSASKSDDMFVLFRSTPTLASMPTIEFVDDKICHSQCDKPTLLEISLANDIPHFHACDGLAKCSTCRVLVIDGTENLTPRSVGESSLAQLKGFESDVRLACQTRAAGNVKIRRIVRDDQDSELSRLAARSITI